LANCFGGYFVFTLLGLKTSRIFIAENTQNVNSKIPTYIYNHPIIVYCSVTFFFVHLHNTRRLIVAKKNPNKNRGIFVTVKKRQSVRIALPCIRLQRKLLELLEKAKVRSTEYIFTIEGVGQTTLNKPVEVKPRPETALEFKISVVLAGGEYFTGVLKAPVKCVNDGLLTEISRAAAEVNASGWHEPSSDKIVYSNPAPPKVLSANQRLQLDIVAMLQKLEVEIGGLNRDIARLRDQRDNLAATKKELEEGLEALRKPPRT
jgi:hypothetical protein